MLDTTFKDVWKAYGIWASWVGLAFFAVYPTCNWLTSHRTDPLALYLESELKIPFIPEFIWGYLSMYVLFLAPPLFLGVLQIKALGKQLLSATFLSGFIFLLFPTRLGFDRAAPEDPFYGSLYLSIFALDLPHNMVPSLHVVFSTLILFALLETSSAWFAKMVWWIWIALILASTVLVHQHHLLDVTIGLVIAWIFRRWIGKGGNHA